MKIGLAGDWHGNTLWARHVLAIFAEHDIHEVYQLGDFGLGWPGVWNRYINEVQGACTKNKITLYVIPGNHENYNWMRHKLGPHSVFEKEDGRHVPQRVSEDVMVLPRGHRWEVDGRSFVALGGAPSIDFERRTPNVSWWAAEMITPEEAEAVAADGYADVMLTHDAPDGGSPEIERIIHDPNSPMSWGYRGLNYARQGRELMNIAFAGVKPRVFAHGHYHEKGERIADDTTFISLPCDSMQGNIAALHLDTLEHEWIEITR